MRDANKPADAHPSHVRSGIKVVAVLAAAATATAGRLLWRLLRGTWLIARADWRRLDDRRRLALIFGALTLGVGSLAWSWWDVPRNWREARDGRRPLLAARSWHYNLSNIDVDLLAKQKADLLVIDYASGDGDKPLAKDDVARIKAGPDAKRRFVISYISIGEAESYRFYWRPEWDSEPPGWHVAENCSWPRNHMVRFWHDGWKDIVYRGPKSYLGRIIDAGFDGVYLDRIDVFGELEKERPAARQDMIEFVREMAATARKRKPGFLFIAQNAETLLSDPTYRLIIDALGKEDLLYGVQATNVRNPAAETASNVRLIRKLQWDWKPIFAVEYLAKPDLLASAQAELEGLGIVPTFAHRSLDGGDPLAPRAAGAVEYGTAEWTAKNCKDKPHW